MMVKGKKKWYPLRIYFSGVQRILETADDFGQCGLETFVPKVYKLRKRPDGRETKELLPAVTDLIFVRAAESEIQDVIKEKKNEPARIRNVSFIFRKTGVYKDLSKIIDIPDRDMEIFQRAVSGNEEYIFYIKEADIAGKKSKPVTIVGGRFDKVEGEVIRVDKNRHVVVRLQDFLIAAITYIPSSNLVIRTERGEVNPDDLKF